MTDTTERYPVETLDDDDDDGTMPEAKEALAEQVVGRRIVNVERVPTSERYSYSQTDIVITLDDGKRVRMVEQGDCCAYTEIDAFLLNPALVEHAITGVGTTDDYQTWHIFADYGDVLQLKVAWSCGNPFYYAYGFTIKVEDIE